MRYEIRTFTVLVIVGLLSFGCATPYQEYVPGGTGGYYDFKIEERRYYVSFVGNGYTSRSEAYEMARYRAAEIGVEQGYPYLELTEVNRNASHYKAPVGARNPRDVEQPVVTMIVRYYSLPPGGDNVLRSAEIYR